VKIPSCLFAATVAIALGSLAGCGGPDRPATWAYISPVIFQPSCASGSCHSPGVAAAGLDLSDPDAGYSSLTRLWVWIVDRTKEGQPNCGKAAGTIVCERPFRPLVTPYDPQQSRLVNMLRGRGAPRMPPDRPLDEADIELVERWILNGAKKNEGDVDAAGSTPAPIPDGGADGSDDGSDANGDGDAAIDGDAGAPEASVGDSGAADARAADGSAAEGGG
jgi:hypothetical protein